MKVFVLIMALNFYNGAYQESFIKGTYEDPYTCSAYGWEQTIKDAYFKDADIWCIPFDGNHFYKDEAVDGKKLVSDHQREWNEMNKDFNSLENKRERCKREFDNDPSFPKQFPKCFDEIRKLDRERVKNDPNATWWDKFVNMAW